MNSPMAHGGNALLTAHTGWVRLGHPYITRVLKGSDNRFVLKRYVRTRPLPQSERGCPYELRRIPAKFGVFDHEPEDERSFVPS